MIFSVLLENTFFVVAAVSAGIDVVAAVVDVVKASHIGAFGVPVVQLLFYEFQCTTKFSEYFRPRYHLGTTHEYKCCLREFKVVFPSDRICLESINTLGRNCCFYVRMCEHYRII